MVYHIASHLLPLRRARCVHTIIRVVSEPFAPLTIRTMYGPLIPGSPRDLSRPPRGL